MGSNMKASNRTGQWVGTAAPLNGSDSLRNAGRMTGGGSIACRPVELFEERGSDSAR